MQAYKRFTYYRNAGSKVYHRSEVPYNRTGRAVCGAKLTAPAFIWESDGVSVLASSWPLRVMCNNCWRSKRGV